MLQKYVVRVSLLQQIFARFLSCGHAQLNGQRRSLNNRKSRGGKEDRESSLLLSRGLAWDLFLGGVQDLFSSGIQDLFSSGIQDLFLGGTQDRGQECRRRPRDCLRWIRKVRQNMSTHMSTHMSTYMPTHMSTRTSKHMSTHMSMRVHLRAPTAMASALGARNSTLWPI